jgi:hypothetical protein
MNNDETIFKHCLWAFTAVLLAMIGSCTAGNFDRRAKWEAVVKNGADPLITACALYDTTGADLVMCTAIALKK